MINKPIPLRVTIQFLIAMFCLSSIGAAGMPVAEAGVDAIPAAVPTLGGCEIFPADNYWNTRVDNLPVHPSSAAWINSIGRTTGFHMDFGSGNWAGGPIGIPYNVVPGNSITKSSVDFYYPDESDPGPYPIPANPNIEWGSDHHILIVDSDTCKLYEIYDAWKEGSQWFGGSGAIWSLNSHALRPNTWTSGDAAGLPILPGLARYEEVQAGVINHALRFTANCTANYYLWPARHRAQYGSCASPVPFGARFRLKANYNISGFSPQAQVILQAMKTYGIVLADNGSPWYVSGAPHNNWDNDQLHELDVLAGDDFEAVNTYALMVDPNSAQTSATINLPLKKTSVSAAAKDGWILESSETSDTGGSKNAGASVIRLGDDSQNRQYRGLLHFDTSSLPNNAVVYSVKLRIKRQGMTGTNPFTTHGALLVDIRKTRFGDSAALQLSDFKAAANRSAAGRFGKTASNGWYNVVLDGSAHPYINLTGVTQFRLRFTKDDNNDFGADFVSVYSGNAGASDRPRLIVQYYIP